MSPITLTSLDHLVLTVKSIPTSVDFYTRILGLKHEVFESEMNPGVQRHAIHLPHQKINLHEHGSEFVPHATHIQPGSGDLCFLSSTPIEAVLQSFKEAGIEVLKGTGANEEGREIVERTGARGSMWSVYVRDPDGNLIEVSNLVE